MRSKLLKRTQINNNTKKEEYVGRITCFIFGFGGLYVNKYNMFTMDKVNICLLYY